MRKICCLLFMLGLLFGLSLTSYAQVNDTVVVSEDMVDDKPNYFNAVTEEISAPVATRQVPIKTIDSLQ
jgi:hypothetical protein